MNNLVAPAQVYKPIHSFVHVIFLASRCVVGQLGVREIWVSSIQMIMTC